MMFDNRTALARNQAEEQRAIERIRRERSQRKLDAELRSSLLARDPQLAGVLSRTIITVVS